MNSFALYRLPRHDHCVMVRQTCGQPLELASCRDLNGLSGFVVAPFQITEEQPLLVIRPDVVEQFRTDELGLLPEDCQFLMERLSVSYGETDSFLPGSQTERACYAADFARFHAQLQAGAFQKIVLSRCRIMPFGDDADTPLRLFARACALYPRLFVALSYTPRSGLWLMATPETLLSGQGERWHTVALAGTMKLEGDHLSFDTPAQPPHQPICWETKNIEEQRLVATYIADRLKPFASHISEQGPQTVRAANLVHLRSDFDFTLYNNARVGDLLDALHPTPAVCGLPKQEAMQFILAHEHTPRRYYSGFLGPLDPVHGTHLYVSLRCMQIAAGHYRLYAGGGLLKSSREEQEWQETEAKLETMKQCIATKKTSTF